MKLWLLERIGETDYDEALGFVVRAESEAKARQVLVKEWTYHWFDRNGVAHTSPLEHYGGEGQETWLDPAQSSCIEITTDGDEAVLLRSFHNG